MQYCIVCAQSIEVDGISYNLNSVEHTAAVANVVERNRGGSIVIPSTISSNGESYTVTSIRGASSQEGWKDRPRPYGAFSDCKNISSITLPETIESIGLAAFWGCESLDAVFISSLEKWCNIKFDAKNEAEGYDYWETNPLCYAKNLYVKGEKVTDLVIPENVTRILPGAFIGGDFSSVTFHEKVKSIGTASFLDCNSLKHIYSYSPEIRVQGYAGIMAFSNEENIVLHIREAFKDNYLTYKYNVSEYDLVGYWMRFGKVEYIDGYDFNLIYYVDGAEYERNVVPVGTPITPISEPTREGYTFSGWQGLPDTMPDHDVTVTGTFAINKYKLTYMVDGNVYKQIDITYNDVIVPEAYPTRKGMSFSGWGVIPPMMPAKDVVATGSFSWMKTTLDNITYQVSDTISNQAKVISSKNISGEIIIPSAVDFDESYYVTSISDKAFYNQKAITSVEFPSTLTSICERAFANIDKLNDVYCYAEEVPNTDRTAFENSYIEDYVTLHVPAGSISKYKETAPWKNFKAIVATDGTQGGEDDTPVTKQAYTLTYVIDGVEYKAYELYEGDAINPEDNPTKEGYTFSGWSEIPGTMPGEDVVITGTFTINSYKLTYYLDGVEYKTYSVEYGSSISPENAPEKEGYTFSGWGDVPQTMPAGDVTLYGTYTVNTYKLIFMVDGEVYKTIEVKYGDPLPKEEEPTKDGYIFSGWSWIPSKMPAEDVTIIGTFKRVGYNVSDNIYIIEGNESTFAMTNVTSGDLIISPTIVVNNTTYNVTAVAGYSCMNNTGITSVTIPDGVAVIGDNAFYGCTGVKSLSLGKDIGYIGNMAFAYIGTSASARKRASSEPLVIECHAESVPDVQNDSFEGIDMENVILKVDDDLVVAYKNLYPWSQFTNIVGFNAPTGIHSIYSEKNGDSIFSIDGRMIDKPQKGMNIIRTSQGTRKVIVK